jgi:hypothetical protein
MFDFLKPKRSAVSMGESFAQLMPKILVDSKNEKVEQQIASMIEMGASPSRIRAEFAAFTAFNSWTGMAAAAQKRKVREPQLEEMLDAFYRRLQELSETLPLSPMVSVSYSSFAEYLIARLDGYINISTTCDAQMVGRLIVDKFCDYACDGEPSPKLKLMVLSEYVLASGSALDIIAGFKLT